MKNKSLPFKATLMIIIPATLLTFILLTSILLKESQQYSLLAHSLLKGKLYFLQSIGGAGQDPVFYKGHVYWSEGIFPAILLMPFYALFSLFHLFFYQNYLQWLLVLGVFWLIFKTAKKLAYSSEDSLWMAFAFTLGSVFIGVASASASWYFAQVVTTLLLVLSLYVYFVVKPAKWWLLGIICGLILLTRVTAAPIVLFYALEIYRSKASDRIKKLVQLGLPVFICLLLIGLYNFLRFHTPLQGGYAKQSLFPISVASERLGLFSLVHVPSNLESFLLGSPSTVLRNSNGWTLKFPYIKANLYGMSIFITSPYLLTLFSKKWSLYNRQVKNLLLAALASGVLVFTYFGIGIEQYGYRYSLDFFPEIFLVFMIIYRKSNKELSGGMKALIIASSIFSFYLLMPIIL